MLTLFTYSACVDAYMNECVCWNSCKWINVYIYIYAIYARVCCLSARLCACMGVLVSVCVCVCERVCNVM